MYWLLPALFHTMSAVAPFDSVSGHVHTVPLLEQEAVKVEPVNHFIMV
jgi:hypothetical protein